MMKRIIYFRITVAVIFILAVFTILNYWAIMRFIAVILPDWMPWETTISLIGKFLLLFIGSAIIIFAYLIISILIEMGVYDFILDFKSRLFNKKTRKCL